MWKCSNVLRSFPNQFRAKPTAFFCNTNAWQQEQSKLPSVFLRPQSSHASHSVAPSVNHFEDFENIIEHSTKDPLGFAPHDNTSLNGRTVEQSIGKIEQMQESDFILQQQDLESRSIENAVKRYRKAIFGATERKQGASLPPVQKLLLEWYQPLVNEIRNKQREYHTTDPTKLDRNLRAVGPYISLVDGEKLGVLTFHAVMGSCLSKGRATLTEVALLIGDSAFAEVNLQKLKKLPSLKYILRHNNSRKLVQNINKFASTMVDSYEIWPRDVLVQIGSFLIDVLINVAKFPVISAGSVQMANAFIHEIELERASKRGYVKINEELTKIIESGHLLRETIDSKQLPMIIQPKSWENFDDGGYLTIRSLMMRTRGGTFFQLYVLKDAILQDVFEGLNVLNETKWIVNKRVFDVVKHVWENGGGIGDVPSRSDDVIPEKPEDENYEIFLKWRKKAAKIKQHNQDLHSLRCDISYKLQVAQDFIDKSFYFPHNIDFRGRAYPIPPHLNHLGCDLNRGLLLFEKGIPIGKRGIFWLKIHLANLYGKDKYNFEERIEFVDENLENIFDSADCPLTGKRWWLSSENPWQVLSACYELTDCLRSSDPENYVSHIPIQMDGSCNGLQHYAALGRDNLGALHVNLLNTETPMDVYNGVLAVVLKHIEYDAQNGERRAQALLGKVYRSTIKQTVMTSVYGVTFVGARDQIQRRLKEKKEIEEDLVYECSAYLAKITLRSLGEVFRGAKNIMDWLNECAHSISTQNNPVMWTTPLGLPVVQPYRATRRVQVKTVLQSVVLVQRRDQAPVNRDKQKSAFPPNYVHSLDATHMLMTARACKDDRIEFASVHDSYWTNAATVDIMNHHIREQFVKLHSQPLLETLASTFKSLYPTVHLPPTPKRGALKLDRVMKAPYFFD